MESPGDTSAEAYMDKFHGPQAFTVNVAQALIAPQLWKFKVLKELRKALVKDGLNFPWAMTLHQEVVYHPCVPKD